jgi:hypothetical protein
VFCCRRKLNRKWGTQRTSRRSKLKKEQQEKRGVTLQLYLICLNAAWAGNGSFRHCQLKKIFLNPGFLVLKYKNTEEIENILKLKMGKYFQSIELIRTE